jgi:protein O-mannosyl-transferase
MSRPSLSWLGLAALLLAAWLAYLPGLAGGFLFDDFVNLPALGKYGAINDGPAFWRYLTAGNADPTGRPLSLLTFLLDARDWPADPAPFLRSNLVLHLANGALLFVLLRQLGRHLDGMSARTDAAALLGAGMWLLHPLLVSTTLYIVQREAMVPATFTLLGLIAYVHGRGLHATRPRAGEAWMLLGIGLGTLLALLSKANGILLPVLALVLEATVLRTGTDHAPAARHRLRQLRWLLLVLPTLVVAAYLASFLPRLGEALAYRPWTIGERLLTEPRVLLDYLQLLVVPRVLSTGLYNDAYVASTGLLQPPSTLLALAVVLALVAVAFAARRRAPALAAALLFFFAGHLLESTVIPLELYFEHRNYIPAMLLFWPLARSLCAWRVSVRLRTALAIVLLAFLAAVTWQRATLWGQPEQLALLWAAQSPQSSRAQATAASFEARAGRTHAAMQRLQPLWRERPHDLQLALNYTNAACAARGVTREEVAAVEVALRHATEGDQLVHVWLGRALDTAVGNACPGLDLDTVERWLAAAQANPRLAAMPGRQQDLHSMAGRLALARGDAGLARTAFNRALAAWPTPQAAGMQAAMLATGGHYRHALGHLDFFESLDGSWASAGEGMPRLHAWVLARQGYWPRELAQLRRKLETELATPQDPLPERGR